MVVVVTPRAPGVRSLRQVGSVVVRQVPGIVTVVLLVGAAVQLHRFRLDAIIYIRSRVRRGCGTRRTFSFRAADAVAFRIVLERAVDQSVAEVRIHPQVVLHAAGGEIRRLGLGRVRVGGQVEFVVVVVADDVLVPRALVLAFGVRRYAPLPSVVLHGCPPQQLVHCGAVRGRHGRCEERVVHELLVEVGVVVADGGVLLLVLDQTLYLGELKQT